MTSESAAADDDGAPADPALEAIAASILDGVAIDWPIASSTADPRFFDQLHVLADLVSLHRSLSAEDVEEAHGVPPLEPGATWGALALQERIGGGAFGDVYRAWDTRLHRHVALKVLRSDRNRPQDADASIREGRLLARVRHPNVVTVHGADRIDGRVGIWTEFVAGRTLAELVHADGCSSPRDAADIGVDLCKALGAVHDAGLLHRDVKPQNIMRERDGRTVLMDFGTGQLPADAGEARGLAGTPLYLAPEVLNGAPADIRSDVYGAGVTLYYLLTATVPVQGTSVDELRAAHAAGRSVPVLTRRPDIPRDLAAAIDRAVSPDPARRFASAAELGRALEECACRADAPAGRRWWALASMLALAVVVGVAALKWTPAGGPAAPRWLLVSAFENHTDDPRLGPVLQVAFEQELMQSRDLTLVPRERLADTLRLMRRPPVERVEPASAREVSLRDGDIGLFSVGRIDRVGSAYTMTVTIEDVQSGTTVLTAGIDAPSLDGILDRVKSLAGQVRAAIGESSEQIAADARLERATTASFDALAAYTTGVAMLNERRWSPAEVALREAVRKDPEFPTALIMLSHAISNQQRPQNEYLPIAARALELSGGLPARERYFVIGSYHSLARDHAKAIPAYEILVREYPNDFWGVNNLVVAYERGGRHAEALPLLHRRLALRPNDFNLLVGTAQTLIINTGDVAAARPLVRRAAGLGPISPAVEDPSRAWMQVFPVFDLWAHGQVAEAAAALDGMAADARLGDQIASAIGLMNVTLGRLRAAEDAFRAMSSNADRQELLAYASVARNDPEAARAAVRADGNLLDVNRPAPNQGSYGKGTLMVWTMIRAGLVDEAERFARRGVFADDPTNVAGGLLLAARGNLNEAAPILEVARKAAPGNPRTFLAIEALAEGLIHRGDLEAAEETLLQAGAPRTAYPGAGSRGYLWLRLRARLIDVARRLGHTELAADVERELRSFLVSADADFALLRVLQ